jgi:hypothetical protein
MNDALEVTGVELNGDQTYSTIVNGDEKIMVTDYSNVATSVSNPVSAE